MRSLWPQLWPNNEHWWLWVPDRARCARLSGTTEIDSIFKQPLRAQRSNPSRRAKEEWIASSASLLAMTAIQFQNMTPHSRGAMHPSFARQCPSINRGRRECRVPNAPAAPCAMGSEAHECSHHRYTGVNPAFPAQWFYGLFRALPGDEFVLSPSLAD
jgi:hypothetical protein